MHKIGRLQDGSLIYQLSVEEVEKLKRREGVRKNRAQSNASLKRIIRDIEQTYDLPEGSVRVLNLQSKDKKAYRGDVRIGTIRRNAGE